jgi:tetratricopeptide (TPR) repeat protein
LRVPFIIKQLKPLLEGAERFPGRTAYSESFFGAYHFGWAAIMSVTDGRYRLIDAPQVELYDVLTDPGQHENLAGDRPEMVATLRTALSKYVKPGALPAAGVVNPEERERLEALGYVGVYTQDEVPTGPREPIDPKDKRDVLERYRGAVAVAAAGEWTGAVERFRALAGAEPALADVWLHLASAATRAERHELAVDAFKRVMVLRPEDQSAVVGAANASLRMRRIDEARELAASVTSSTTGDSGSRAAAHEVLARTALLAHDAETARAEAALAEEAEPGRPVGAYVDGRIAYDQGHYAAAAAAFEQALKVLEKTRKRPLADLRYYTADTFLRLERFAEAEYLFLEELKERPLSARLRAGLATVYRATGRTAEAAAAQH